VLVSVDRIWNQGRRSAVDAYGFL